MKYKTTYQATLIEIVLDMEKHKAGASAEDV
jgi:hypothetical protein